MLRSRECLRSIRLTDVNILYSVPLRKRLHIPTIVRATLRCGRPYQERMSPSHCPSAFGPIGNADSEIAIEFHGLAPFVLSARGRKAAANYSARKASIGCIEAARMAGSNPAAPAQSNSAAAGSRIDGASIVPTS
jgi:hypothetical protein